MAAVNQCVPTLGLCRAAVNQCVATPGLCRAAGNQCVATLGLCRASVSTPSYCFVFLQHNLRNSGRRQRDSKRRIRSVFVLRM
jgi:hypothetical protein